MHIWGCQVKGCCLLAIIWMSFTDDSFSLQLKICEKIQATTDILSISLSRKRIFSCCWSSAEQGKNGKHTVHLKSQDMWKGGEENWGNDTSETSVQRKREMFKLYVTGELLLTFCVFLLRALMFLLSTMPLKHWLSSSWPVYYVIFIEVLPITTNKVLQVYCWTGSKRLVFI